MSIVFAFVSGLIQGLAEFLPISSSGHLALVQSFFNTDFESNFSFNILLHLATLAAVLIVYGKDVFPLIPAFFTMLGKAFHGKFKLDDYTENERMVLFIIIATIPLAAALVLKDQVEILSGYPKIIGGILIVNGILLYSSDLISAGVNDAMKMKPRHAFLTGLFQLMAIVPGLSRSGSTIIGGRICGFDREFAVKFSFILSIPAVIGANVFEIPEFVKNPPVSADIPGYLVGVATAFITGIGAMKLLQYISRKKNFRIFAYYCVAVGIFAVIFA